MTNASGLILGAIEFDLVFFILSSRLDFLLPLKVRFFRN